MMFSRCGFASKSILLRTRRSVDHAFTVCVRDESENQAAVLAFSANEKSVLVEFAFGNLCVIT